MIVAIETFFLSSYVIFQGSLANMNNGQSDSNVFVDVPLRISAIFPLVHAYTFTLPAN